MRIVFMGTPSFAASILEELISHHEIAAVYTRPDAVRARGKSLSASPVKSLALQNGIEVYTPSSLRSEAEIKKLADLRPDVICVAAYGMILPKEVLVLPPYGCLNVHASLLPRWRGAAPIERAILAGDTQSGVCIMRMEEGLDTGDWCVCRSTDIADKNAEELTDELANLGARALLGALEHTFQGKIDWMKQSEEDVCYAPKLEKGELNLDPCLSASMNARFVQASGLTHPSRCEIGKRRVSIVKARAYSVDELLDQGISAPQKGEARLISKRLLLGCCDGAVEILSIKPDGKKTMEAQAFAAGLSALKEGIGWRHLDVRA